MIDLKAAKKVYTSGNGNEFIALDGVNLQFQENEFVVVIGANGSGKSTLLNAISGDVHLSSGSISIAGQICNSLPSYQRSQWIGRVFQNPLLGTAPDLSILDNFRLAALRTQSKSLRIGTTEKFRKTVQDKISALGMGLENKLDWPIGSLSGGQRQALTLLMAVMDETKVLLLDEPTAALDPKSALLLMNMAQALASNNKLCIVLVTHELKFAYHYGNRLIQLAEGKVIRDLSANEKSNLVLNDLFSWFA